MSHKKVILSITVLSALSLALVNSDIVRAACGNNILDSGEQCDFNPTFGPYPNQCPNNGPCDQSTCKCVTSGASNSSGTNNNTGTNSGSSSSGSSSTAVSPNSGSADTSGYKSLTQFQYSTCQGYDANGYCTGYAAHSTGYKSLYAPNIICNSQGCTIRSDVMNCTNMADSNARKCSFPNSAVSKSKFYLPPGTTTANITVFSSAAASTGHYNFITITRFGEPPQGAYYDLSGYTPDTVSHPNTADMLTYLANNDYIQGDSNGIITVFRSGNLGSDFPGGWVYIEFVEGSSTFLDIQATVQVDGTRYTDWYNSATWQSDGDPAGSSSNNNTNTNLPTGPDCASKVCLGNSCWNGTKYIEGQKTQNCATGSAQTSPSSITPISENPPQEVSYITWTSSNASKTDAGCTGPTYIAKGGWYNNTADCVANKSCPDQKGYPAWFHVGVSGTEICTFYPTNASDNLPGTPYSATIQVLGTPKCGNNILEEGEQCDYNPTASTTNTSYVPCPQGQTCKDCQCTTATTTTPVCQPDDPSCADKTCSDVYCFDGCNYQKGTRVCTGRK